MFLLLEQIVKQKKKRSIKKTPDYHGLTLAPTSVLTLMWDNQTEMEKRKKYSGAQLKYLTSQFFII